MSRRRRVARLTSSTSSQAVLSTSARLGWTEMGRPELGRDRLTGGEKSPGLEGPTGPTCTWKFSARSLGLSLRKTSETPASTVVLKLDLLFFSTTCKCKTRIITLLWLKCAMNNTRGTFEPKTYAGSHLLPHFFWKKNCFVHICQQGD